MSNGFDAPMTRPYEQEKPHSVGVFLPLRSAWSLWEHGGLLSGCRVLGVGVQLRPPPVFITAGLPSPRRAPA